MKRLFGVAVALVLGTVGAASQCVAQSYPVRPIRIIVPFTAGGGLDLFARVLGQKMSESLGQQVIVENRLGAQGNIGMAAGAKAPPDGYTLTAALNGPMVINPFLYADPGFDPLKDFAPISLGTVQPEVLIANPRVPAATLKDLVALARAHPGKLTFGSSASGGQLAVELLKQLGKVDVLHVPYKAATQAATDLIGGYLDFAVMSSAAAIPFHKSGRAKIIVVLGPERASALPAIPSALEAGMPGLQMLQWFGIIAPAGTPKDIVAKLNTEINRALAAPDVRDRLIGGGLTPKGSTVEEFAALIRSDYERFANVFKRSGAKPAL